MRKSLVHTVAKTASGPKCSSCAFDSNLIRVLNGFSAQPFSAFTVTPYLRPFHCVSFPPQPPSIIIITICHSSSLPFCPYLSLSNALLHCCVTCFCTSHFLFSLACFSFMSLPIHLAHLVFLSHSFFFFSQFSPPHFSLFLFISHHPH